MNTSKTYNIETEICAPDFDLGNGDQVQFIEFRDNCEFVNNHNQENGTNWQNALMQVTKCPDCPELVGETGEFIIDKNTDTLVSY